MLYNPQHLNSLHNLKAAAAASDIMSSMIYPKSRREDFPFIFLYIRFSSLFQKALSRLILWSYLPGLSHTLMPCPHKQLGKQYWPFLLITHLLGNECWYRKWQPSPVFLPGESHRQRSLVGYSPWGHKELDTTEQLSSRWRKKYRGDTCIPPVCTSHYLHK